MRVNKTTEQSVLSFELLVGTDGKEKMSKSLENYVAITDEPSDMYGKIMSVPDAALKNYFELCTYTPMDMVKEILEEIEKGGNPRDAKMRLAKEIVSIYHGEGKAVAAEEAFVNTFQKGGIPENMPEVRIEKLEYEAIELLQLCFTEEGKSNSDIRRLFEQGAISLNEVKVSDIHESINVKDGDIVKAGKKTWFKLTR